jgi:hypothetical protein
MRRPLFFAAFSLFLLLLLQPITQAQGLVEALQECPSTLTGGTNPEQIHLQISADPTEMTVIWATDGRADAEVEWSSESDSGQASGQSYCYNQHDMAFHIATMTGLPLATEISYTVGAGNTWSDAATFTTIDPNSDRFEWISIADHGISTEGLAVSDAIIADSTAQMVTISGDISYANGDQSIWDDYFDAQEASMMKIPWVTAVGNHENEPGREFEAYEHRFDADGIEETEPFWYSLDVPGVHMVFMSTEHPYDAGSAQFEWLENDLASVDRTVTPFVIVYGHKPMYSSNSYHGSEVSLRDALEAMYIEAGVDLVIAGHDHFYERTWPVAAGSVTDKGQDSRFSRGAPIHLVIGIAGRSAYEELDEPQPEWSAYRENSSYGWTRLVYDGEARELTMTQHLIDGTIHDQFTIQEAPLTINEEGGLLSGFDPLIPLLALFAAALRRR